MELIKNNHRWQSAIDKNIFLESRRHRGFRRGTVPYETSGKMMAGTFPILRRNLLQAKILN